MNAIKLLSQTAETVTISRADLEALLQAAEDAEDIAAVTQHRRDEARAGGHAASKANYLTAEEAKRLLDGENPVRVWREKRGMTQRALADAAKMQPGYLSEIETGKKPGSLVAYVAIAAALSITVEDLI
jgi:DNA-binding XRE family transcriptional regulator